MDEYMAYLIGYLLVCAIFGIICRVIAAHRGMEGGYWWGFFLGIIGIIIVAVRPKDNGVAPVPSSSSPYEDLERLSKLREQGVLSESEYIKIRNELVKKL